MPSKRGASCFANKTAAEEPASRVGYASRSQFNREYARVFCAPPRKDVDALTEAT